MKLTDLERKRSKYCVITLHSPVNETDKLDRQTNDNDTKFFNTKCHVIFGWALEICFIRFDIILMVNLYIWISLKNTVKRAVKKYFNTKNTNKFLISEKNTGFLYGKSKTHVFCVFLYKNQKNTCVLTAWFLSWICGWFLKL
jgi:hypothetical protein